MVAVEKISRQEWLDRNPIVRKYVEQNPVGWSQLPAFNLWPDPSLIQGIDDHQRENLYHSLAGRIGILGGSPGTGKTYTLSMLIRYLLESGIVGAHEICAGAPTGKAAVRLTELLQSHNLPLRARTWHSILGIGANGETGGWEFKYNANCKLPYRVLIGDESSMLDLSLMLSIFRAREVHAHVLLVGDVNQLPPVGAGAPMRDLILAGLPFGELTEIKRNSGGIVEACAAIRDSKPWRHFTTNKGSNLRLHEFSEAETQVSAAIKMIREAQENGMDPVWDCQVLVAVNEKSKLSRKELNTVLQDELNPGPKENGTIFRVFDKVVCLKNGFYRSVRNIDSEDLQTNERGEVYVANGELGEVTEITTAQIVVELDSPARVVAIPFKRESNESGESGALAFWDLAYALSVHKAQGSEVPVAIVMLDDYPGARQVCDRAWLYTAISRAKKVCHLVGKFDTAERFVRVQKISQRKTFLREMIGLKMFEKSGV
jgi:exodeoxyribonuclease V alpha subunit